MDQVPRKKVLYIFGKMGSGKSNAANNLLQKDIFNVGNGQEAMTTEMNRGENDEFIIFDFPGTGEHEDRYLLEFDNHRQILIKAAPINAFIFVSKLDNNNPVPSLDVAKDFYKFFGIHGLKTLVFLCIQDGKRLGQDQFKDYLHQTEAYIYLNDMLRINNQLFSIKHVDIQHCLWDNQNEYHNQQVSFRNCLNTLQRENLNFKSENLMNPVQQVMDEIAIIKKRKKETEKKKKEKEKSREKMEQLKSYSIKISISVVLAFFCLIYLKN
jgi:hypothetical protein